MITLFLKKITGIIEDYKPYKELLDRLALEDFPIMVRGASGVFLAFILSRLSGQTNDSSLIVVPTEREADELVEDLSLFTDNVFRFPPLEIIPYRGIKPQSSVLGERIANLKRLLNGERVLMVVSLRGLLTPVPPADFFTDKMLYIYTGGEFDPIHLEKTLSEFGYLRVPTVSSPGEFAMRGEVLDVFLPGEPDPSRVVFEFDTVEEIRSFDPITQSSLSSKEELVLYPAREILWTEERISSLRKYLMTHSEDQEEMEKLIGELKQRRECKNEDIFFPLSFSERGSLKDYLSGKSLFFIIDHERLLSGSETVRKEYRELFFNYRENIKEALSPDKILLDLDSITAKVERKIIFSSLASTVEERNCINLSCDPPRSFFGNISYLKEELSNLIDSGYSIWIFAESSSQGFRIEHLLKDLPVEVVPSRISSGFSIPKLKFMVIQENEIFGRRKRIPQSVRKARTEAIDTFVELTPGDYVVHLNYGIGRFSGIDRMEAAGKERDYIKLEYADEETLFLPIEQVNLIQRYIGSDGAKPRLDRLGGKSWERRKNQVKKSVEDLAERLLRLYSRRKQIKGFSFPRDTDWQIEFEAGFPYEETEDQLRCIEEVKADMEKDKPMDRLICGDVGFGKTEVAMRAAFKAVVAGKQVAYLAPTTILAEQHYENFAERFRRFPVNIAMISRFISRGEQKRLLNQLERGEIDIIIGTHRILQRDVRFNNLGLLIVDEEQRFGVKDKERLKELKHSVDCLTLTATPIPRTLHMALLKIRDMSLLATPPPNRQPIETYICEFDEEVIARAIRNEVARGGQVYYLHNSIETLRNIKSFIQRLVPEVIVETAHGRMVSRELEEIMHRFIHGGIHVLASTTIIENGIDIPNVNTIIVDHADIYGISQLYQLRGRVGRSDRSSFAYLLYPAGRVLTEVAMKRLRILSDYTALGSGFKIALKDLEIRGAGNLLGREQHGDILSVGFDMYIRLLDNAIRERTEEKEEQPPEVYLELDYSGFIPDSYIKEPSEKMEFYKKIASVSSEEELSRVYSELEDKFGPLPDQVQSLLSLAEIRIMCRKLWISSLKERRGEVEVEFSKVAAVSVDKILRLIRESGGSVKLDPSKPNVIVMKTDLVGLTEKSEFIRDRLSVLV